jgi:hypothetical protein
MPMNGHDAILFRDEAVGETGPVVRITTGVKLRGPEGAERLRALSAATSELDGDRSRD